MSSGAGSGWTSRPRRAWLARSKRAYDDRTATEVAPTSSHLLTSTHDAMTETRRLLGEARGRFGAPPGRMDRPHRLMRDWLLAEQALNRAGDDGADRAGLVLAADEARKRYQAALDKIAADFTG